MIQSPVKAKTFRLRTQLLSHGRSTEMLAETDPLKVRISCYAEGGENALHTHLNEDHTFIVLQGKARFFDQDHNATELTRNEGIMLPHGAYYNFQSCGDENLVMLRVASKLDQNGNQRMAPTGKPLGGKTLENGYDGPPTYIEGAFYE